MGHQLVCTMCCACGSGYTCANPFSTKPSVTDVTDNSDTESDDDDNHDHDNDQLRTQTLITTIMIAMMILASCVHTICNLSKV